MLRGYLYRKLLEKKEEPAKKEKKKEKAKKAAKKPKKELHNVHENPSLFAGIIIGLLGGVLGNVLVFSAHDVIDSISAGNSWIIFLAALGGFIVVIWFLLSVFRKSMYR
jgi:uncharacterized membrane protein YeaQ/YmgE (transglycosylase-associated protein family)